MEIRPLGTRVLVKPDNIKKTYGDSDLVIPDTARDRMMAESVRGTVIDVGKFAWIELQEKLVQPGDKVIFAKWGGLVVKGEDGEDYRLLNDEDIIAVIKKESEDVSG